MLDNITLASSTTARNLGIIFDQDLSFDSHIKKIQGPLSSTYVILQKLGLFFLRNMQRNWSMH